MLEDFLKYQAQTTPHPLAMEVSHAKGSYVYDAFGKAIWILSQGFGCSLNCHPAVVTAVKINGPLCPRYGLWRICPRTYSSAFQAFGHAFA